MEKLILSQGVFLKRGSNIALYLPNDMRLFKIQSTDGKTLEEIASHIPPSMCHDSKPIDELPDPFSLQLRQAILPMMVDAETLRKLKIKPNIDRLTINISNACNLWCAYCYADHGHYHAERSLMPPNRACDIINRIYDVYGNISIIHFFGGEPLMNLPAVKSVAELIDAKFQASLIDRMPSFVATTNGTISSKKVISLLKNYKISLTLSWDGPKEVQDDGRPMLGKGSSYDNLIRSIERFSENDIPYDIECTFNSSHLSAGMSIVNLMDFFFEKTGRKIIHIAPASTPNPYITQGRRKDGIFRLSTDSEAKEFIPLKKIIEHYRVAARYSVQNFIKNEGPILDMAYRVIQKLLNQQKSARYCPAFFDQLSISADGSAYPCFMFMGDSKFRLGNVLDDVFPNEKSQEVFFQYFSEFGTDPIGTQAWHKNLFSGCIAGDFISTGEFNRRYLESLQEAIVEECIFGLAVKAEDVVREAAFKSSCNLNYL